MFINVRRPILLDRITICYAILRICINPHRFIFVQFELLFYWYVPFLPKRYSLYMFVNCFYLKCKELSVIVLLKVKNICIKFARFKA